MVTISKLQKILIDTNILIDFMDNTRQNHNVAVQFIKESDRNGIGFYITPHTLNDCYYYQMKTFKKNYSNVSNKQIEIFLCDYYNDLLDLFTVIAVDHFDIKLATKLIKAHADFEDNLVIASAKRLGANYVLTSDASMLKDYPNLTINYNGLAIIFDIPLKS